MMIDVLLSTYNGDSFVDVQIESILQQTYKEIHLIIRDDGSKDATPQKLLEWKQRYPDKIDVYLEENVGVIESFNKLYTYSTAPYLAFCDQDDYWVPRKLETCLALLDRDKPSLVHSDLKVVNGSLEEIHPSFWDYSLLSGDSKYAALSRLLIQNVVTGCTTLFNRELGELAFPVPKGAVMHDWWLALVASHFGSLKSSPEKLIHYRQHGNNVVGAKKFTLFADPRTTFSRIFNLAKHERQKGLQAEQFLLRYKERLSTDTIELLHAFLSLKKQAGFSRARTIINYKFYKIGWQRNLFHLIRLRKNMLLKK